MANLDKQPTPFDPDVAPGLTLYTLLEIKDYLAALLSVMDNELYQQVFAAHEAGGFITPATWRSNRDDKEVRTD
jgi:hypothetical protein